MGNLHEISDIAIEYLKSKDGIKGDIHVYECETHEITMKDGKFTLFRTMFDENIRTKVIKDHKKGTGSINKFTKEAVIKVIDDAITSADAGEADVCFDIAPGFGEETYEMGVLEPDIDKLIERTKELAETITKRFKKIKLMELYTKYIRSTGVYINTNGSKEEKSCGYYQVVVEFAGNDGENSTGIAGSYAVFDSLDKELIEIGNIEKDLINTENSLNPITLKDKFDGDIILTPDCAVQLLSFLLSVGVGERNIIDKTSVWYDKIGQQVASPLLTLGANTWDDRIIDHETHTDDGFKSEDFTIIEKGVLKSYLLSLYGANKTGFERALNTSMAAVVEPGDTAYDDMIKSVKKGLIVGAVSCGIPSSNGEISGVAKNSFYVENGEVKSAVIETMISANLFDMFKNIKAISKEQLCNGTMVMPAIQISGVTISGK